MCHSYPRELVKVWSALTLLGSYGRTTCAFSVEKVGKEASLYEVPMACEAWFACSDPYRRLPLSYHWLPTVGSLSTVLTDIGQSLSDAGVTKSALLAAVDAGVTESALLAAVRCRGHCTLGCC